MKMSPFMHAHEIKKPILLIHGEEDTNSGTNVIQSERFFAALKGNGADARLVLLPHESHSTRALESVLHVLAETSDFLDKHLSANAVEARRLRSLSRNRFRSSRRFSVKRAHSFHIKHTHSGRRGLSPRNPTREIHLEHSCLRLPEPNASMVKKLRHRAR